MERDELASSTIDGSRDCLASRDHVQRATSAALPSCNIESMHALLSAAIPLDELRRWLSRIYDISPDAVDVCEDFADIARNAPLLARMKREGGGQFPVVIEVVGELAGEDRVAAYAARLAALCREFGIRAMVCDESSDPYNWVLIDERGMPWWVDVDADALDTNGEVVVRGPCTASHVCLPHRQRSAELRARVVPEDDFNVGLPLADRGHRGDARLTLTFGGRPEKVKVNLASRASSLGTTSARSGARASRTWKVRVAALHPAPLAPCAARCSAARHASRSGGARCGAAPRRRRSIIVVLQRCTSPATLHDRRVAALRPAADAATAPTCSAACASATRVICPSQRCTTVLADLAAAGARSVSPRAIVPVLS